MFKTKLHVSGTEGTHNYVVIAASPLGIIAVRLLNSNCYRVRVEPDSPEGANTIAKSLAIGDPADGYFANKLIKGSGGWAEDVTDEEIGTTCPPLASPW